MYRTLARGHWMATVLWLCLAAGLAVAAEPVSPLDRGNEALDQQEWDAAVRELNLAIEAEPNNLYGYRGRAFAYMNQGKFEEAIPDLNKAIELDPTEIQPYRNRAICYLRLTEWERAIHDLDQVLRLDSTHPGEYIVRGRAHRELKEYSAALADFDEAIRQSPESAGFYELRGATRLVMGDVPGGIADLNTAIERNPDDPAKSFEDWPKTPLTAEDLEHGKQQLRQMLHDRPAMARYGENADALYQWAIRKFAGEDLGRRVFWDDEAPTRGIGAMSGAAPNEPGYIQLASAAPSRLGDDPHTSFEYLWKNAVFELYNVLNGDRFADLRDQVEAGELSKAEYVQAKFAAESRAVQKTRSYFVHRFLPWAVDHSLTTHPAFWYVGQCLEPHEASPPSCHGGDAAQQVYEFQYDWSILHSLMTRGEFEKAVELGHRLLEQAVGKDEEVIVRWPYGTCLVQANRPRAACDVFTGLIRLTPQDADCYFARAAAYYKLGELRAALDDFSTAIQLAPQDPGAYAGRSEIYELLGEHEKSVADAQIAESLTSGLKSPSRANGDASE